MPEVTLRDAMVLVGSLLILAVAIDAWRRMRSQQRERVRVKLAPEVPGEDPGEDLALYRELPNGGARVVSRRDLLGAHGSGPSSDGSPAPGGAATDAPSLAAADEPGSADAIAEPADSPPIDRGNKDDKGDNSPSAQDASHAFGARSAEVDVPLEGMRAQNHEPTNLDWLEDIPEPESDTAVARGETPHDHETEVIILHVMSRSSEGFCGKDILEILLACDLRFGDMNFFHRHEQQAGRGPIQFSVANMLQPGVFDIDRMDEMYTRGLVFFITLPGPEDMIQAFDYMLETARVVARNLGGELLDESRSVLTQQAVEHSRQQIRELERRLLAQRG